MNTVKTVFLMTLVFVLFLFIGQLLGGQQGLMIAFMLALAMNFFSYWFSDKFVLTMYRAKQISKEEAPKFYTMVEQLASSANLPMPKVYIIEDETPNAFATGRNPQHAVVAATTGILNNLNNDEMAGVIAHELAHVKHRDILTGTIISTFVGTITFIASMARWSMFFAGRDDDNNWVGELVLVILAPIAATLLQLAISRSREFAADEGSAKITGNPMALANALAKISNANEFKAVDHAGPATAHMFIINPLKGGGISKLFSTHPPTEERIRRLKLIAEGRS